MYLMISPGGEPEFLCLSFAFPKYLERRQSKFHYQLSERLLSERLIKIIDPLCVDAVFTKQRCQISARRSGGFFVYSDFVFCHFSIFVNLPCVQCIPWLSSGKTTEYTEYTESVEM